jgi:hypothetical protein
VAGAGALIPASGPYEISIFHARIWNLSLRRIKLSLLVSALTYIISVVVLNQCPVKNFIFSFMASFIFSTNSIDCQGIIEPIMPRHEIQIAKPDQSKQLIAYNHYVDNSKDLSNQVFINSGDRNKLYINSGQADLHVNVDVKLGKSKNMKKESTAVQVELVDQKDKHKIWKQRFRTHKRIPLSKRTKTMSDLKKE